MRFFIFLCLVLSFCAYGTVVFADSAHPEITERNAAGHPYIPETRIVAENIDDETVRALGY